jgi:small subunit ribosomal protein S16
MPNSSAPDVEALGNQMAVQIRLARHGSKKSPFYRIVVTDKRNPRDGRYIERLGMWNPVAPGGDQMSLDEARLAHWTSQGALTSPPVTKLVKKYRAKKAGEAAAS